MRINTVSFFGVVISVLAMDLALPAAAVIFPDGQAAYEGRFYSNASGKATNSVRWQMNVSGGAFSDVVVTLPAPFNEVWQLTGKLTYPDSTLCDFSGSTSRGQKVTISHGSCQPGHFILDADVKGGSLQDDRVNFTLNPVSAGSSPAATKPMTAAEKKCNDDFAACYARSSQQQGFGNPYAQSQMIGVNSCMQEKIMCLKRSGR